MSNVSGIGDAYYWSVFKIAEAFGLHRDTVKKRLLAANTPVAATVRGSILKSASTERSEAVRR